MQLPVDYEFCVFGVGAIIEKKIKEKRFILIQNRIRDGDVMQNHLIEVPCGKIRSTNNMFEVLRHRVSVETGLRVKHIRGEIEKDGSYIGYNIQSCNPFYVSQNVNRDFPVAISFFICEAQGTLATSTEVSDNIRWISVDDLENMLLFEREKFFPMVIGALDKYVAFIKEDEKYEFYE